MKDSAIVVVTTVGNEEQANLIAREMVSRRHASCVNVVPGIRSTYRWQGNICTDSEFLLLIKSMQSEYELVAATIQELHTYDLPEILAFEVGRGEQKFLEWIEASLDKNAEFSDGEPEALDLDDGYP